MGRAGGTRVPRRPSTHRRSRKGRRPPRRLRVPLVLRRKGDVSYICHLCRVVDGLEGQGDDDRDGVGTLLRTPGPHTSGGRRRYSGGSFITVDTLTCVRMHTYGHTLVYVHTPQLHKRTHPTYIRTHRHIHTKTRTYTYIHILTHIPHQVHTQTHMYMCTHTYMSYTTRI